MATIDLDTLREMLATAELMIEHHGKHADEKALQNAALIAAGLKPLHDECGLGFDAKHQARYRKQADVLRYVITYHEGGIVPAEPATGYLHLGKAGAALAAALDAKGAAQ